MVDRTNFFGIVVIIGIILLFVSSTSELAVSEGENRDIAKANSASSLFISLMIITSIIFLIIFYRKLDIEKSECTCAK